MTSIPHYEDMSVGDIYQSLDLEWTASEKLDGSFLEAGLDDDGQFYTKRKGGQPVYDLEDWPYEMWAMTYRSAHIAASQAIECLVKEDAIHAGNSISFEVLEGERPNSIIYHPPSGFPFNVSIYMVVTSTNWKPDTKFYVVLEKMVIHAGMKALWTYDGERAQDGYRTFKCGLLVNKNISTDWIQARLSTHAKQVRMVLDNWLPAPSHVEGFSQREVLEANLSRKHVNAGDRNWNNLRRELSAERVRLREIFNSLILLFKDAAFRVLTQENYGVMGAGSWCEGVVVQTPNGLFKIVERLDFTILNRATHAAKYAIVGGRRPARPSFLSRTKSWPKEKRLARLNQLLKRYRDYRYSVCSRNTAQGVTLVKLYSGDLHYRTLAMFYDTKKRIEDGR